MRWAITFLIILVAITAYGQPSHVTPLPKWTDGNVEGRPRLIIVSPDVISFTGNTMSLDVSGTGGAETYLISRDDVKVETIKADDTLFTYTYSGNGAKVNTITDGTNTWTITRDSRGRLISCIKS
jgi:hypothetical protein